MLDENLTYLSQGVDYLGFLNSQLRDLRGYGTVANELMQNADDAQGATEITFDVRDDALVVTNNGIFTDCGHVKENICPWRADPAHEAMCDFHRFRATASGDKRRQANTIGAFGVGFISVYQITDHPEVESGRWRWTIDPEAPEGQRIRAEERHLGKAETTFRCPWARQETTLRAALGVETVGLDVGEQFLAELLATAPSSILFLQKVNRVEIRRNGSLVDALFKTVEDELVEVQEKNGGSRFWYLVQGDFDANASALRDEFGPLIETTRRHAVQIALPLSETGIKGKFFSGLPTEHFHGMPFHVNTDFYPNTDRKRILLGSDYQGRWNCAAVAAAAEALANALPDLPRLFEGHEYLWDLLESVREVHRRTNSRDSDAILRAFWAHAEPIAKTRALVPTTSGKYLAVGHVRLLLSIKDERGAIRVLNDMGLDIVADKLSGKANLLRELGVRILSIQDIVGVFEGLGLLGKVLLPSQTPAWLSEQESRISLIEEVGILRNRVPPAEVLSSSIWECPLLLTTDGRLAAASATRIADEQTRTMLSEVGLRVQFAADAIAERWAAEFSVCDAVDGLEETPPAQLLEIFEGDPEWPYTLAGWFRTHSNEIDADIGLQDRLARLAIWPSGGSLLPLNDLSVPGDFEDPLGLSEIVDVRMARDFKDFLVRVMRAAELTVSRYAEHHVPQAFKAGDLPADARDKVVDTLARHLGQLKGKHDVRQALAACPIARCGDGLDYRLPRDVYFDTQLVRDILGDSKEVLSATWCADEKVRDFCQWLGVQRVPRGGDVVARLRTLTSDPQTPNTRRLVQGVLAAIGRSWTVLSEDEESLHDLRSLRFMPVEGSEHWFAPGDVAAVFRKYLFASQARFLDLPQAGQAGASEFIDFLGVQTEPTTRQVVDHLREMAAHDETVNREVYRFLSQHWGETEIARLESIPCLSIDGKGYTIASRAFWSAHRFGKYRVQLDESWKQYAPLLNRLGVKDAPSPTDAFDVLTEVSSEYGGGNRRLDDEARAVVLACWESLSEAFDAGQIDDGFFGQCGEMKLVPNGDDLLLRPSWVFFEDRPQLVQVFGEFLKGNAVARPAKGWPAMLAAGVRYLSKAVKVSPVKCEDPAVAVAVSERLAARHGLVVRVLLDSGRPSELATKITDLKVLHTARLDLNYELSLAGHVENVVCEDVVAHVSGDSQTLYFRNGGSIPWAAIARELSFFLTEAAESGQLALTLQAILSPESTADARQVLDDAGFAPVADEVSTDAGISQPAGVGADSNGGARLYENVGDGRLMEGDGSAVDASGSEDADASKDVFAAASTSGNAAQPSGPAPVGSTPQYEGATLDTDDDGGFGHNDADGSSGGASASGPKGTGLGTSTLKGRRRGVSKGTRGPGEHLRSYVSHKNDSKSGEGAAQAHANLMVCAAGVARVISHEKKQGRLPAEMPHTHPGYDIESRLREDGPIERYIEVKSLTGSWTLIGVGLTHTEYEAALNHRERYWLYVVEHAQSSHARLTAIQNPASRVTEYFFDDGWRVVGTESDNHVAPRSILDIPLPPEEEEDE